MEIDERPTEDLRVVVDYDRLGNCARLEVIPLVGPTAWTRLGRDGQGRIVEVVHGGQLAENHFWFYDPWGRPEKRVVDKGGKAFMDLAYDADSRGLVVRKRSFLEDEQVKSMIEAEYDDEGRITSLVYGEGARLAFERDPDGRVTIMLQSRDSGTMQPRSSFCYGALGWLRSHTEISALGNGETLTRRSLYSSSGTLVREDVVFSAIGSAWDLPACMADTLPPRHPGYRGQTKYYLEKGQVLAVEQWEGGSESTLREFVTEYDDKGNWVVSRDQRRMLIRDIAYYSE